mgnify:CR=1 FL=1
MKQIFRQFLAFLKNIFWTRPTDKPEPFKATEVLHLYTCIKYKDQWINLKKTEVAAFDAMARSDKRAMAMRFKQLVKKGHIKFVEINGEMTCVKNKDYENR